MKTEFLKSLGIEDQAVIDQIMAENGKDINAAKSNKTQLETQVTELTNQLNDRDAQLKELKKSAKDNETLTAKITELEQANQASATEYEAKIANIQKTYAIENGVRDAKAKNVKAVMALLDTDKITFKEGKIEGLSEQIEALTNSEDTSFLFGEVKQAPTGTNPKSNPGSGNPNPPTGKSFAEAIAAAIKN